MNLTNIDYNKIITNKNFKLTSTPKSIKDKVEIQCLSCEKKKEITLINLLRKNNNTTCKCSKPYKYNKIKINEILQAKNIKLLSTIPDTGVSIETKLIFLCKCNKKFENTLHQMVHRCNSCGCDVDNYFKSIQNERICGEISKRFYNQYKEQAKRRNIKFDISPEDIWNKFLQQNKKCELTGETLIFSIKTQTFSDTTASIDRKNINLGYTVENIRFIHKIINTSKWEFDDNFFIELCNKITYPLEKQKNLLLKNNKENTNKNWHGYKLISGSVISHIRNSAKKRNIKFNLNAKELYDLFIKQDGLCYLTNEPLIFGTGSNCVGKTASLDRIDPTKDYEIDNVCWIHKNINKIKRCLSINDLKIWAKKVVEYANSKMY